MLDQLVESFVAYASNDDNRKALESKFLQPVVQHLGERFAWSIKAFQALTALVFLQTVLILWLLIRSYTQHV